MYLAWALIFQIYYWKEKKFRAIDYAVTKKGIPKDIKETCWS